MIIIHGGVMKINRLRLENAIAAAGLNKCDIKSVTAGTLYRALNGSEVNTKTVYKLSKELNVNVSDILQEGE